MSIKQLPRVIVAASALWASTAPGQAHADTSAATTTPWLADPTDAILQAAAGQGDALIWFAREGETTPPAGAESDPSFAGCRLVYPERSFERPDEAKWFISWASRFAIEGIPSVVAVDGQGQPYARIAGAPDAATLQAVRRARVARDTALTAAETSTGLDRARHLDAALQAVGPYAVLDYRPLAEEVVTLDPDNAAGLRDTYAPLLAERLIDEIIQGDVYPLIDGGAYAKARDRLSQLETTLPGISAEQRQMLTAFRAQLLLTEGNPTDARALMEEAIALAPASDTARKLRGSLAETP